MDHPTIILITFLLSSSPIHGTITTALKNFPHLKVSQDFRDNPLVFPETESNKIQFDDKDHGRKPAQIVRFEEPSRMQLKNLKFLKPTAPSLFQHREFRRLNSYVPHPPHQDESIAGAALNSITDALNSVARYDDLQCVSRLLCEAASGKAPNEGPGFLQTVTDLQPLITLLAYHNGVISSPLFVFSRAVFLGMASSGKSEACHKAYPRCPTETEKLVDYLNNYNGGFFRFFKGGSPKPYPEYFNSQTPEQFKPHISNIATAGSYGLLYSPHAGPHYRSFGFNQENLETFKNFEGSNDNEYLLPVENSDLNIEDRILNLPVKNEAATNYDTKLHHYYNYDNLHIENQNKLEEPLLISKEIKFPGLKVERQESPFSFPEQMDIHNRDYPNIQRTDGDDFYGNVPSDVGAKFEFVYILRGNQDPNHPSIVKIETTNKLYNNTLLKMN